MLTEKYRLEVKIQKKRITHLSTFTLLKLIRSKLHASVFWCQKKYIERVLTNESLSFRRTNSLNKITYLPHLLSVRELLWKFPLKIHSVRLHFISVRQYERKIFSQPSATPKSFVREFSVLELDLVQCILYIYTLSIQPLMREEAVTGVRKWRQKKS